MAPPPGPRIPIKWRLSLVLFLALYPLILAVGAIFTLIGNPVPFPLQLAITLALLIPFIVWVYLPWVQKNFGAWLNHPPKPVE